MTISNTMTGLMNAMRNRYALTGRLSVSEAINQLQSLEKAELLNYDFNGSGNVATRSETPDGLKYTASDDGNVVGTYFFYDKNIIVEGKRFLFNTLIRGNFTLNQFGNEGQQIKTELKLDPNNWRMISFAFFGASDIIFYGKATKGQWFELKKPQFFKLGGVIKRLLYSLVPQNGGACYDA